MEPVIRELYIDRGQTASEFVTSITEKLARVGVKKTVTEEQCEAYRRAGAESNCPSRKFCEEIGRVLLEMNSITLMGKVPQLNVSVHISVTAV